MSGHKTFLYFAYASNLNSERLQRNIPSAIRIGYGKLRDYQLNFDLYSKRWRGASATIVERKGSFVWGAIWEINCENMETLDRQEGVFDALYKVLNLEIDQPNGEIVKCRLYQQTALPPIILKIENLPEERKPSLNYLNIILKGADESKLPEDYKLFLKSIPSNGYDGKYDMDLPLNIL